MKDEKTIPDTTADKAYGDTTIAGNNAGSIAAAGGTLPDDRTAAEGATVAGGQTEANAAPEWKAGDVILDTYEVMGLLGEGGMARVFRVLHKGWNAELAMKCARSELFASQSGKEAFVHEATAWANLGLHPNAAYCYYVRIIEGIPHVFAELVEGGSLTGWIGDGRLYEGGKTQALVRILDVAIQSAWGLHHAHEQGLVHQDVKPANILMAKDGQPKITDFGLAGARNISVMALEQKEGTVNATWGGMTPAYCSPEQARIAYMSESGVPREEWPRLSRRTDIWSWAATVLEMFIGERIWTAGQAAGYVLQEYRSMKASLPAHVPEMPEQVFELLAKCLTEDEAQRPAAMPEIAAELIRVYGQELGSAYPREAPEAAKLRAAALNNRAVSLYDLGKREEAERVWEEALQDDPNHPESVYNLGLIRWRAARITDDILVHKLEEICLLDLPDGIPQYLLAQIHMERCDYDSATGILEKLRNKYPENRQILLALEQAGCKRDRSIKCLRIFEESPCPIHWVSMCADGRYALSGGLENAARLWDAASGKCLRTFEGHTNRIRSVCISADGRFAVSGSEDKKLKLWNASDGVCLRTFEGDTNCITSICISADGQYVLSGDYDGIKLWDISTGQCLHTLGWIVVSSGCASADFRFVLSDINNTIELWDILTEERLRTFKGHTGKTSSVCMSSDGRFALSGSHDQTVKLWNISSGKCIRTFKGHNQKVTSVCMSADGRFAFSGGHDYTVRQWDIATGRCLCTFEGHSLSVESICLNADNTRLLSGGLDSTLRLWIIGENFDFLAPFMLSKLPGTEKIIREQSIYKDRLNEAIQKGKNGDLRGKYNVLQEIQSDRQSISLDFIDEWKGLYPYLPKKHLLGIWEARVLGKHKNQATSVCISPNGRYAITGSIDETIKLWDILTGECLRTFKGHTSSVESVCISADDRYIMSGSHDRTLRLWDIPSGECVRIFEEGSMVSNIHMNPDSRYVISNSLNQAPKLWDIGTAKCLQLPNLKSSKNCYVSADGRYVLSGGWDGMIIRLDLATGQCLQEFRGASKYSWAPRSTLPRVINSIVMDSGGRYALSGNEDKTIRLHEISTGKCLHVFGGHTARVTCVCMSADGRYALSGSVDKTIRLWDIPTGECVYTFEGHTAPVTSICMSPDMQYILSVGDDYTLRLWSLYWELEWKESADWDGGAKPYLTNFLAQHTPYAGSMPADHEPSEAEFRTTLMRKGKPVWNEDDFQKFLHDLGGAGYGWLRPEGVRAKLSELAADMTDGVLRENRSFLGRLFEKRT